jgi:hypothetical protein
MTTQGYGLLQKNVGSTDPLTAQAAAFQNIAGGPLDVNQYMDPYVNDVVNRSVTNANTALTQQLAGNAAGAEKAGAFGGSRFGVQQGVAQAQGSKDIGDLTAGLMSKAYDTATATAQQQQQAKLAAAQGLLSTAGVQKGAQQQDITNLMTGGQQDQAQQQNIINAAMQKFQQAWDYPTQQLNTRLAALGMSPYGQTTTSAKTSTAEIPPTDWASVLLGGAKALPGMVTAAAGLPAAVTGIASALGPLALLSDRDAKKDITKLSDGDIPAYSYRYKGAPDNSPKIVGPMAQDVEKKYPKAVKKIGKYKHIDLSNLMEALS